MNLRILKRQEVHEHIVWVLKSEYPDDFNFWTTFIRSDLCCEERADRKLSSWNLEVDRGEEAVDMVEEAVDMGKEAEGRGEEAGCRGFNFREVGVDRGEVAGHIDFNLREVGVYRISSDRVGIG